MAGVVAAKLKLKKQQQEEEAAQVMSKSQSNENWIHTTLELSLSTVWIYKDRIWSPKWTTLKYNWTFAEQVWSKLVGRGKGGILQKKTKNNIQG